MFLKKKITNASMVIAQGVTYISILTHVAEIINEEDYIS